MRKWLLFLIVGLAAIAHAQTSVPGWVVTGDATGSITLTQLPTTIKVKTCELSIGDGFDAITAGTYPLVGCKNDTGATLTITGVQCYTDAGTSTCNVTTSHAGTPSLLTGNITGSATFQAGVQSATTTLLTGEWLTASLVADGTTKRMVLNVIGTL